MRQFAEQEIWIPSGKFKGRKFRCDRQPYSGLWFDQISSGRWRRMAATGPVQSGKSLTALVIPAMYHLFEIGETIIVGLPSMEMAADKWEKDFGPAIEASRYRDFIPSSGSGSRGGKFTSMTFRNGATLRFMSGGGNDKKRAGYTARVVFITEADGMDEPGDNSREADKVTQIEARTESYGDQAMIYLECTTSIDTGRIWQEYIHGSQSRIVVQCRDCGLWVTPEREHLVGWQDAESQVGAKANGRFCCPECGILWSEDDRELANQQARLVHRGQEITPEGVIVGEPPETDTLGFRWNGFNNLFQKAGDLAVKEFGAARSADPDNAETGLLQFSWALPIKPQKFDTVSLDQQAIIKRLGKAGRGVLPPDTVAITVGQDLGAHVGYYLAIAWQANAVGIIFDYAAFDISSRDMAIDVAIITALRTQRDTVFEVGWDGRIPDLVWTDSGYEMKAVYAFTRESGGRYRPTKGHGIAQERSTPYFEPHKPTQEIPVIGDGWHVAYQVDERTWLIHINSDHWKTRSHQYLASPPGQPGSLVLYNTSPQEHLTLARHLTAERRIEEFKPGKGTVVRWHRDRKQNHYLDCLMQACAAADHLGVKPLQVQTPSTSRPRPSEPEPQILRMPDGRPFLLTERL